MNGFAHCREQERSAAVAIDKFKAKVNTHLLITWGLFWSPLFFLTGKNVMGAVKLKARLKV